MIKPNDREVSLAELDNMIAKLAWVITESKNAHLGTPLWQRFERERAEMMEHKRALAAARLFLKRRQQTRP